MKLSTGLSTADVYVQLPQLKRSLFSSTDYSYFWPKDIGVLIGRVSAFIRDSVDDLVEFEVADAIMSLLRFQRVDNQPNLVQNSLPMTLSVERVELQLSRGLLHRSGKGELLLTQLSVVLENQSESQQLRALYSLSH